MRMGVDQTGKDCSFTKVVHLRIRKLRNDCRTLAHGNNAFVFDGDGAHLKLAPQPTVPTAQALYLKVCGPKGCQSYVTFSGQQIRLDGALCDVLLDHRGNVLLVGERLAWSSAGGSAKTGPYRVEGKRLEGTS